MEKCVPDTPNTQPPQPEVLSFLEAERERLVNFQNNLATTALSETVHIAALAAADMLVQSAVDVREAIIASEVEGKEAFGGEESYWTVYRMFASVNHLGQLWSIEEIWDHLAKSYDMAGETYQSLEDTLQEWREDIEQDAADRWGLRGSFLKHGDKFVFAELQTQTSPIASPGSVRNPQPRKIKVAQVTAEQEKPHQKLAGRLKGLLESSPDDTIKQSIAKKALVDKTNITDATIEQLQEAIDELVADGHFYKFQRGRATHLSLIPRENEIQPTKHSKSEKANNNEVVFDIPLSLDILTALCAPGAHYQQKLTLNELWRKMHNVHDKSQAVPEGEIEQLKQACNRLRTLELVTAGGEKRGTSGTKTRSATSSKRRRSGTAHVYKVGLASQQIKKELQDVLGTSNAVTYLETKLGSSRPTDDDPSDAIDQM